MFEGLKGKDLAIIHVNKQFIAMNAKDGRNRPVYTTKIGSKTIYSRGFVCHGPLEGVAPGKQLSCGARAWLVCRAADIEFKDPMTFKEAKEA